MNLNKRMFMTKIYVVCMFVLAILIAVLTLDPINLDGIKRVKEKLNNE